LEHDLTAARKSARTSEDAAAIAWAQEEIERLRAALKPFADRMWTPICEIGPYRDAYNALHPEQK
jgi:hypothetical protein